MRGDPPERARRRQVPLDPHPAAFQRPRPPPRAGEAEHSDQAERVHRAPRSTFNDVTLIVLNMAVETLDQTIGDPQDYHKIALEGAIIQQRPRQALGRRRATRPRVRAAAVLRGGRLVPRDVRSQATDLEKHHEVIKINQALSKSSRRQGENVDGGCSIEYLAEPRRGHLLAVPIFAFDENVSFNDALLGARLRGWQQSLTKMEKPPASVIAWRIPLMTLTEVYYDHLSAPSRAAASRRACAGDHRVARHPGGESARDLVAWSSPASRRDTQTACLSSRHGAYSREARLSTPGDRTRYEDVDLTSPGEFITITRDMLFTQ